MTTVSDRQIERFSRSLVSIFKQLRPEVAKYTGLDLTRPQFFILMTLSGSGPYKVTQLAEEMEVKPSAITVMIDRLVSRGYVERRQDEHDRRVVLLALTEGGRQVLNEVKEARNKAFGRRLSRLTSDELEQMLQAIETILE